MCNRNAWARFTKKYSENLNIYIYIFRTIKASSGEYRHVWFTIILPGYLYTSVGRVDGGAPQRS